MKKTSALATGLLLGLGLALNSPSLAHEKEAEQKVTGSIKIQRGPSKSELPGLATVSMADALAAALKKVPGKPMEVDLEEDDGYLVYNVLIVGADKKVSEVTVDAGNGKVLAVEAEDEDEEDDDKD